MHKGIGKIYTATAPSNIALIKYWGKRDEAKQWPANDSLSMTLNNARTETKAQLLDDSAQADEINLHGVTISKPHKLHLHLDRLRDELGLSGYLRIESHNTYPMACGIASSASGFAALTLAATAALSQIDHEDELATADHGLTRSRLAHLARLGSGSAGRSFFGGYVEWNAGAYPEIQRLAAIHDEEHFPLADVICIVSSAEKSVSSTVAHRAAWTSPLFRPRLAGLKDRMDALKLALQQRDFDALGPLIEAEALEMHAVIMSAAPAVQYMTEASSQLLTWVREQRQRGMLPAYFTMDAGPNVHLICRPKDSARVAEMVRHAFPTTDILADYTGSGPSLNIGSAPTSNTNTRLAVVRDQRL